ncbi:hypothetical protein Tco_0658635 [Tanacetum coccineum]
MPSIPSPKPTVSYFDDLNFFKDFENEFLAIVYNDAQTSKSDLLTELILNPEHIDEFNLKDETSLSEYDEEEQNVICFNDLFPFNVIYLDELKTNTDNDNNKVDIEHSSGDLSVKPLPDVINTNDGAYAHSNYGVIGERRYGVSVPALTKDHRGIKINTPYIQRESIRCIQDMESIDIMKISSVVYSKKSSIRQSLSFEDEDVTMVKVLMAIAKDEPAVGKVDVRSGQWVEFTMKRPPLCGRSEEKLTQQIQSFKQELSSCKSKLIDLKNTKAHKISLQNEITRLNLDNESLKDEVSDLKKVIEKWTSSKVTLDQLLTEQVLGNIVCALRGRGKRMETISSKEIVFSKGENSSSEIVPEVTSDTKSEYDNQEPPPPLLKFTRDEPIGTSNDVTPLADLVQTSKVFDKIKQVTEKESLVNPTKKKTQTMSPSVPDPSPDKKADSSTE